VCEHSCYVDKLSDNASTPASMFASWLCDNAESPTKTAIAGIASESVKPPVSSWTCVASADSGRYVVWSFDDTSSTFPKYGSPVHARVTQTTISSAGYMLRNHVCYLLIFSNMCAQLLHVSEIVYDF